MMLDLFDFYDKMERNNILLSFKGDITSDLLTSILQIMESKMDNFQEEPKTKKKVYNVLVECLQNLYHHMDDAPTESGEHGRSAIFMIGKLDGAYNVITGNYILNENVSGLKSRLDEVNSLTKEELKGLGMVDIARKTGQKLHYTFQPINEKVSFFSLNIKVTLTQ